MNDALGQMNDERALLAPLAEEPDVLPVPKVDMSIPHPAVAPYVPPVHQPQTDKELEEAIRQRDEKDQAAQFAEAATLFNRAGGGHAGDLSARIKATREDPIKDLLQKRMQADQQTEREKKARADALEQALQAPNSPETLRARELFGATQVGQGLRNRLGEDQFSQLTGAMIPGAKEMLASETDLLKHQATAGAANSAARYDANSPISRAAQAEELARLQAEQPELYEKRKDRIPLMSYEQIGQQRAIDVPANRVAFNPVTGEQINYDRKRPETLPKQSTPEVDPNTGLPKTPKMEHERQQALLHLGSPSSDWQWDPAVTSGKVAPPPAAEVKKANETTSQAAVILDAAKRIDEFYKKHPNGYLLGKDAAAIEPWVTELSTMARGINNLGVWRAYDQPIMDAMIQHPTEIKAILKSVTNIRDLPTQFQAFVDTAKQRAWSMKQQVHQTPSPDGRWADFKPVSAIPPVDTSQNVHAPGETSVRVKPGATSVRLRLKTGQVVEIPADKVEHFLGLPIAKGAVQE